jgi:hypothetical protein
MWNRNFPSLRQKAQDHMRSSSKSFGLGLIPVAVLLVGACGGTTTSSSGGAGPVPEEQFLEAYATAICDNIGPCCQADGYTLDAAKCRTLLVAELGDELPQPGSAAVYDANAGGNCIAAVTKVAQSCGGEENLDVCEGIYKGKLAAGEPCTSSFECATPPGGQAYCDVTSDTGGNVCVASARGKLGDTCSETCTEEGTSTSCTTSSEVPPNAATCYTNDGLRCGEGNTCATLIPLGGACPGYEGCVQGAFCDSTSGTCVATKSVGEACTGYSWSECAEGLHCSQSQVCEAAKPDGAACESWEDCESGNCEGGKCVAESFVDELICTGTEPVD